ncbi:glycosyltransferase [uncultured Alsobacter sp.]|uniref:glycosyltransferase n=1 Tax=uncultured Alsobacter sp. TaxID=1748258 RepID=UPI0025E78EE3|nr:glycosyltransferase [uncultured Alsobacter sp.]
MIHDPDPDPHRLHARDLMFLMGHGVSALQLAGAAIEARKTGASTERVLIASGAISEDGFYRALAGECGFPFVATPRVVCEAADVPVIIATGHARAVPGLGHRVVVAPRAAAIRVLIGLSLAGRAPRDFAVTTPGRLEAAVLAGSAAAVASHGADGLPEASGSASYRSEATAREARTGLACVALSAAGSAIDPGAALAILQAVLGLLFLSAMSLRLAAAGEPRVRDRATAPHDRPVPTYTVLVPLYREGDAVVRGLVAALARLDYPRARLEILLLVEAGDRLTRASLSRLLLPTGMRTVTCPDGTPRTKPRALNIGLALTRGDLLVVYDAEDRPEPAQLRLSAATFARLGEDVGCLQASLAIHNGGDGWLARLFRLEYAMLFDVTLPGMTRLAVPVPLGGTSNHFRRRALITAGGWDAWNVTEDADVGLRLARRGFRTAMLASTTLEEAPATLRRWFPQRVRWMKGWMRLWRRQKFPNHCSAIVPMLPPSNAPVATPSQQLHKLASPGSTPSGAAGAPRARPTPGAGALSYARPSGIPSATNPRRRNGHCRLRRRLRLRLREVEERARPLCPAPPSGRSRLRPFHPQRRRCSLAIRGRGGELARRHGSPTPLPDQRRRRGRRAMPNGRP